MLLKALNPGDSRGTFYAVQAAESAGESVVEWRRDACIVCDALVDVQLAHRERVFDRGPAFGAFAAEEVEAGWLAGFEVLDDLADVGESH